MIVSNTESSYLSPSNGLCSSRRAHHSLVSSCAMGYNVSIVCQDVNKFGAHGCLANRAMFSPIVDMAVARAQHTATCSSSHLQSSFCDGQDAERTNQPRKVLIGLNTMSQISIAIVSHKRRVRDTRLLGVQGDQGKFISAHLLSTSPTEDSAFHVALCLHGDHMVLTAGYLPNADVLIQGNDLCLFVVRVEFFIGCVVKR